MRTCVDAFVAVEIAEADGDVVGVVAGGILRAERCVDYADRGGECGFCAAGLEEVSKKVDVAGGKVDGEDVA